MSVLLNQRQRAKRPPSRRTSAQHPPPSTQRQPVQRDTRTIMAPKCCYRDGRKPPSNLSTRPVVTILKLVMKRIADCEDWRTPWTSAYHTRHQVRSHLRAQHSVQAIVQGKSVKTLQKSMVEIADTDLPNNRRQTSEIELEIPFTFTIRCCHTTPEFTIDSIVLHAEFTIDLLQKQFLMHGYKKSRPPS